ncbi:unnamed protein product [Trichobilharzia szidati]|nr:unnamed protein product [Trichobilharzia szidati]
MSTDGCVRYGENYGLIFSPSDQNIVQLGWENERPQTMLAAGCQSCLNTVELNIKDGNEVVATVCIQPVARSVFQIISTKCGMTDCVVKYGDIVQFSLANKNISEERLYLASDLVSPLSASSMSGHQKLYLTTNCCSFLTHWKIVCKEPSMRLETEGCPVKSDKYVVIKHVHTNEAIAVEEKYPYNSYFGREYEASCHTYLDGHKCERDLNHISIATIIPPRND